MDPLWFTALSAVPFIVLIGLLLSHRGILIASAGFLFSTTVIALFGWWMDGSVLLGSLIKGIGVGIDIALIVGGALLFLDVMKRLRVLSSLEHYLHQLCPDTRVQAITIAWLFGALLEGVAGFASPVAIVAPLLAHLGIPPITAAAVALLANTVPVSFGAAGAPLRIGLIDHSTMDLVRLVGTVGAILGILTPYLIARILTQDISKRRGIIGPHGLSQANEIHDQPDSVVPFALWSGVAFALPYWLVSRVNPDLPSIAGGAVGLLLTSIAATVPAWRRLFLPKITQRLTIFDPNEVPLHLWRVIAPFALVIIALALGRQWLPSWSLALPGGVTHTINLFNPGLILLLLALPFVWHGRIAHRELTHLSLQISRRLIRTAAVVILLVAATQVLIQSGQGIRGTSMLASIGALMRRENAIILSPLIGMLGAFVAGSVTVANLMFGALQQEAAAVTGVSPIIILVLQIFGATAGNALAVADLSTVQASLGQRHQERAIMAKLISPLAIYIAILILSVAFVTVLR